MRKLASLAATALVTITAAFGACAASLELEVIAHHSSGIFDKSAAEIVVFDPKSRHVYVVNGATPAVDAFRLDSDRKKGTANLVPLPGLSLTQAEAPTSVAVHGNLIAVAVHNDSVESKPGKIVFFNGAAKRLWEIPAGALPDMVTFTPDGAYVLVANEGEPGDNVDPEGSVTIIDVRQGVENARAETADFRHFNADELRKTGVRIFPNKTVAQDIEPEYIAVAPDSKTAWVSLQENNALGVIDIESGRITKVLPLGLKDHSQPGNGLDPNDKDGINIANHPVFGMYMPDSIATTQGNDGKVYILTANEGDSRDSDEAKLKDAKIANGVLTDSEAKILGKLRISVIDGDIDGDGVIEKIHSYGARSFSVRDTDGNLVWDSGDQIEQITASILGQNFNSDNDEAGSGDKRSDNKGPEPEGIAIGSIGDQTYAFIGLERVSGIIVYNITNPTRPVFATYTHNRNFTSTLDYNLPSDLATAGDLGPEGLAFVSASDSPTGSALLLVGNEVSGTVTVYGIKAE